MKGRKQLWKRDREEDKGSCRMQGGQRELNDCLIRETHAQDQTAGERKRRWRNMPEKEMRKNSRGGERGELVFNHMRWAKRKDGSRLRRSGGP